MTHGPLSWRELVERDKQKSEDARGQIKRAAMPVQADPVAELRAEITRLTEALRAAEERERVLLSALEEWMFRYFWRADGMPVEAARIHAQSRMQIAALAGAKP